MSGEGLSEQVKDQQLTLPQNSCNPVLKEESLNIHRFHRGPIFVSVASGESYTPLLRIILSNT